MPASTFTLITGASKGIGKAMALECASRGYNLFLVARSEHLLKALAQELEGKVKVKYLAVDLFSPDAALKIFDFAAQENVSINMLINNAGMGFYGVFHETEMQNHLRVMQLNMDACVRIAHEFLQKSDTKEQRYLLNVASTAAYQPVPNMTVYAATKAFMLFFSRGLRHELRKQKVNVTALCPGGTESEFFGPAQMEEVVKKNAQFMMKAEEVAKLGIDGLLKNKSVVIPGFTNKAGAVSAKLLPHDIVVPVAAKFFD